MPTTTVGARELKIHLGKYLRLVRSGATFVVTDRGRPVAEIGPIAPHADDEEAVLREMAALGRITLGNGEPFLPIRKVSIRGKPLSQTVIEDREDRF